MFQLYMYRVKGKLITCVCWYLKSEYLIVVIFISLIFSHPVSKLVGHLALITLEALDPGQRFHG